jgi:hypothetical protein
VHFRSVRAAQPCEAEGGPIQSLLGGEINSRTTTASQRPQAAFAGGPRHTSAPERILRSQIHLLRRRLGSRSRGGAIGARKCEANALVVAPDVGRGLCRRAILEHVPPEAPDAYRGRLAFDRERLRAAILRRLAEGEP